MISGFKDGKISGIGKISFNASSGGGSSGGSSGGGVLDPSGFFTTTAVAALNANPNLVLWYSFDALNGTTFRNLATNTYDASVIVTGGTASNGVTVNTNNYMIGTGSANFNGSAFVITTAAHVPTAFTLSFWLYLTNSTGYQCVTACRDNGNITLRGGWTIYVDTTGYLTIWLNYPNAITIATNTSLVNTWTFISFTINGNSLSVYLNGILTSTNNITGIYSANQVSIPLTIGANDGTSGSYPVSSGTLIDSYRFFNTALTSTNIYNLFTENMSSNILLHLDATSASNFTFSSGNYISSWNDQVGNYNFTSIGGSATSYATWNSTLKAVRFGEFGYGQWNGYPGSTNPAILYNTSTSTTPIPLTNGGTFYCVIQEYPGSTWANSPFTFGSQTSYGNLYGYTDGKTMYIDTLGSSRAGPITITPPNGGQNFYNKAIYKVTVTTANVFKYQYITSLNNVSQTYSGGSRGISIPMLLGAGGYSGFQSNAFQGYIYEVLLYNTVLTTTQQTAIENYLINKWSL